MGVHFMMGAEQITLVVAAHPDDETLGCGGTIARLVNEGHSVYIAILGEGITSRFSRRDQAEKEAVETLLACSQQVADLLGAQKLFKFNFPDNRFDTVPLLEVVKIIEELIDRLKPQRVFTQHGGDLNVDHAIVHRATLTATRPLAGHPVKEIYAYEVPSSTDWSFGQLASVFRPNMFMDITSTLEKKIEAMGLYDSEIGSFPHPRSKEALRALAHYRGSLSGLWAAEAFELVRRVCG
jgi:LmbE family N-acetylglucosaminyl deacetylase